MELSFSEILVVCLIAFLVFGPEDFIRRSRQLGQWLGRMRTEAQNFRVMAEEELTKKSGIKEVNDHFESVMEIPPSTVASKNDSGATDV